MDYYSQQYLRVLGATRGAFDPNSPLRFLRFNADHGFTLQDQLLLAPLRVGDDQKTVDAKFEVVGRFVDVWTAMRVWNSRSTAYSTIKVAMFGLMRDIRGLDVPDLAELLLERLLAVEESFDGEVELRVHQQNRGRLHLLLARMTDFVTVQSGLPSNYMELTNKTKTKYEVEHVWADHFDRHSDEFVHESDFARHRSRFGDLLLLPKAFNSSFNDEPYADKRPRYFGQNLLAASLDPQAYEKNPGFTQFVRESGLPFKPHEEFPASSIVDRGLLYQQIAKKVWNPHGLLEVVARLR